MHKLSRQVRFSVTPFLPNQPDGYNSYASKPTGDGLSFYLALWVTLEGKLDPETGFILNVSQIDEVVRSETIPQMTAVIDGAFGARESISLSKLASVLVSCVPHLSRLFEEQHHRTLAELCLELSPFRSIGIECKLLPFKELPVVTYTEKFEFSAMHKLWNDNFSSDRNLEVFGKCANPAGHGHNYILEVAVQIPVQEIRQGWTADFQKCVKAGFLELVDHKNLNADVSVFNKLNPTVENIAFCAWQSLAGCFGGAKLSRVTVWENDRTYCTYSEED